MVQSIKCRAGRKHSRIIHEENAQSQKWSCGYIGLAYQRCNDYCYYPDNHPDSVQSPALNEADGDRRIKTPRLPVLHTSTRPPILQGSGLQPSVLSEDRVDTPESSDSHGRSDDVDQNSTDAARFLDSLDSDAVSYF